MRISFPGVVASFASTAYRIAISSLLGASLGAVRFSDFLCFRQKIVIILLDLAVEQTLLGQILMGVFKESKKINLVNYFLKISC